MNHELHTDPSDYPETGCGMCRYERLKGLYQEQSMGVNDKKRREER